MKHKGMAEPKRSFRHAERNAQHNLRRGALSPKSKRAVNLSIDAELLRLAKEMKINLSQTLESALEKLTANERALQFYHEHKASIDSYNRFVEHHGTLAEGFYGPDSFGHNDSAS